MTEIRFDKVEKRFGDVDVIKSLDLLIKGGEFFTFVGPSGCGKSTILNMLAGLEDITRGNIYFDNMPVAHLSPKERDIAMVFQSYALYPHLSVYENIAFPLRIKKIPQSEISEEVRRVAGLLGLEGLLKRHPKELSGGQRQRVALGRAIIRRPRLFLMDEPLSNLDARLRIEMRGEIKRLHRELKITTIYVTHDQEEAMSLSDRVAVLYNGAVRHLGRPLDIYKRPANKFVAGFIGSPSMNFIDGRIINKTQITFGDMTIAIAAKTEKRPERKEVIIGIRPEDIRVSRVSKKGAIEMEVSIVEPTGAELWVNGCNNGIILKGMAKIEEEFTTGEKVYFILPSDKIHIFDRKTEERL
ncbi:MAG: ABC transporter ATP-binding protein [Nitrospirota bacterium]